LPQVAGILYGIKPAVIAIMFGSGLAGKGTVADQAQAHVESENEQHLADTVGHWWWLLRYGSFDRW